MNFKRKRTSDYVLMSDRSYLGFKISFTKKKKYLVSVEEVKGNSQ